MNCRSEGENCEEGVLNKMQGIWSSNCKTMEELNISSCALLRGHTQRKSSKWPPQQDLKMFSGTLKQYKWYPWNSFMKVMLSFSFLCLGIFSPQTALAPAATTHHIIFVCAFLYRLCCTSSNGFYCLNKVHSTLQTPQKQISCRKIIGDEIAVNEWKENLWDGKKLHTEVAAEQRNRMKLTRCHRQSPIIVMTRIFIYQYTVQLKRFVSTWETPLNTVVTKLQQQTNPRWECSPTEVLSLLY